MYSLEVETEARRRQGDAEPLHQTVVTSAAANRLADRRVVDLENRTGVVAEVAQHAHVQLDAGPDRTFRYGCAGRLQTVEHPFETLASLAAGGRQDLRSTPPLDQVEHAFDLAGVEFPAVLKIGAESDHVVIGEPPRRIFDDHFVASEIPHQGGPEFGVAEADHRTVQSDGVQGAREDLNHLGDAVRSVDADQLDPCLSEFAQPGPLWGDRPVGIGYVAEPPGWIDLTEARRRQSGDRDRHVGPQGEQFAAIVEEAVGVVGRGLVAAADDFCVLDGRRAYLAVAALFENLEQGALETAKLTHLVGEYVPRSGWYRVDQTDSDQSSTRSMCAPRALRRVSMSS